MDLVYGGEKNGRIVPPARIFSCFGIHPPPVACSTFSMEWIITPYLIEGLQIPV